ncbi:hypothetical protein MACK_000209 [Theileria orientalis]|uniref:Uncharacterized protein n=1 Tax=Theileria orientalis TaxID=68886 RepID=A0A976MB43_THEOR|nr:hypothetical protein MACK_000209 [Theileria orientalis]
MVNIRFKLYYNSSLLSTLTLVFLNYSICISTPNQYTSIFKSQKSLKNGFYTFINIKNFNNQTNELNNVNNKWELYEKPIYTQTPLPNSSIPKHIPLDYENLLRSHDPSVINYNTTLTGLPGVNIKDIDDLYGKIYDHKVLMKQLRYFLENDDFSSINRLMKYNKDVLNKEECELLVNDFEHLIHHRLKYEYPEPENLERTMPFLVGRYVLQYVLQQDLESKLNYVWLKPGEVPEVPEYKEDYVEPKASPEKKIHVKDTVAYRSLMKRLNEYDERMRLCAVRDLYHKLIECKRKKLVRCLRKFQRLRPFRSLTYRRKVANKVNIDRVSPFLSRPMRCTDEIVKEYTDHFEEAVNKQDLATACYLLNRYSRRIIFIDKFPLLCKFMRLFAEIHACKKYDQHMLKKLRSFYWSSVKRKKFMIRYNEPMMIMEAGKTMKDMYEEQLEQYRRYRDKKNDEKMKKMGIDMDKVRDFSNAYGMDWIPILYPEEYQEALEYHRKRLEKLRKKALKVENEIKRKRRFDYGEDIDMDNEEEYNENINEEESMGRENIPLKVRKEEDEE